MLSFNHIQKKPFLILVTFHAFAVAGLYFVNIKDLPLLILAHYFFALFGASLGLHKYFSHRHYAMKSSRFSNFIMLVSTLTMQGPIIQWALNHRMHHARTNSELDPHNAKKGFFWSHLGWLFLKQQSNTNLLRHSNARDLKDLPNIKFFSQNYYLLNFIFLFLLFLSSLIFDWPGLFFIFGPIRIVTVWHATWLVNSLAHGAGSTRVNAGEPTHSWLVGLLIPGEGDHKYHHDYSNSIFNPFDKTITNRVYGFILYSLKSLGFISTKELNH